MKPKLYIVTLAVNDLALATAFYQDGLGLGSGADGEDHVLFELQGELSLVLFERAQFDRAAGQSGEGSEVRAPASMSLSYRAESRQEVDELLQRAVDAGGMLPSTPQEYEWGYSGYFKDLDGHLWEIVTFFE